MERGCVADQPQHFGRAAADAARTAALRKIPNQDITAAGCCRRMLALHAFACIFFHALFCPAIPGGSTYRLTMSHHIRSSHKGGSCGFTLRYRKAWKRISARNAIRRKL